MKTYPGLVVAVVLFNLNASYADPGLADGVPLRGFSDFGFVYDRAESANSFQLGEVDFFMTKPLDDRLGFLIELVVEPNFQSVELDLERAYLQYALSPWFKFAAGRFHTSLGYWNDTYHHGRYIQTPVNRPVAERFEHDGGLLPVHLVGAELRGNGLVSGGNLGYVLQVGNGRSPESHFVPNVFSYSKLKSLSGVAFYEFASGLRFGPGFYAGGLPAGPLRDADGAVLPGRTGSSGSEVILGAHAVFNSPDIESITEYRRIHHFYDDEANEDTKIDTIYSQLGYHWGLITPYVRYEIVASGRPDAYLSHLTGTRRYYIAGARYETTSMSALKLEYEYGSSSGHGHNDWKIYLNWSFGW